MSQSKFASDEMLAEAEKSLAAKNLTMGEIGAILINFVAYASAHGLRDETVVELGPHIRAFLVEGVAVRGSKEVH